MEILPALMTDDVATLGIQELVQLSLLIAVALTSVLVYFAVKMIWRQQRNPPQEKPESQMSSSSR